MLVWPEDIGKGFLLEVSSGKITEIRGSSSIDDGKVKVVGNSETILRMFLGKENLAHLYLDGTIQTYGSEKDQIVLDAVAKILWG